MQNSRWGVVYSVHSGSYKAHKRWKRIREYIEEKGIQYDFVQSESYGSVERLVNMLCNNGYTTIVVVGGDGAINDAINAIMQNKQILPPDFAFGVIPNGIGNDFAHFWGLSEDNYRQTIDILQKHHTRLVDVAQMSYTTPEGNTATRYFLDSINIGLGARLVKIINDTMRVIHSRHLSLIPALLFHIFQRRQFHLRMTVGSEHIDDTFMSVCIGNTRGFGQTPNAVPYNGYLDVSTITRPLWWQLFEGFWLLGKGRFLNYKNVHPYRADKITIDSFDKAPLSIDGLSFPSKGIAPLTITIQKEVLKFII